MGDVSEVQQAKKWLYDSLHGNADIAAVVGTRIYADFVPEPPASRVYPYLLYNFMGGNDIDAIGTARIFSVPIFQVRIVLEGRPTTAARLVDKRIDDVLRITQAAISGEFQFSARREQPIDRTELDSATGKQFSNLGGLFRLWIGRT